MESVAKKTINKYLPNLRLVKRKIQLKNLPVIYRSLYDFEELVINDIQFLLLSVKDKSLGPKDFKKHSRKIMETCEYYQIWYLKELHSHKIRRMIENEMNFIIEDKHIYLPTLNLSIKSQFDKITLSKKLIALSINILIREILKADLSGKSKTMIAEIFQTSKMNIIRAICPLCANNLCEEKKVGISKIVNFKTREELWDYLKQNINSPVLNVVYLSDPFKNVLYSGISALAKRSMLSNDAIETAAIYKKDFNRLGHKFKMATEDDAKIKVEIWDRQPTLIENGLVNIIDCYLVLKNNKDERVQIELEKLLEKNGIRGNIT